MKVYFEKKNGALCPLHDSDTENFARVKNGAVFMKDFKKVRNPEFHRLVFDMLNKVFRFQDKFDDFEAFRKRVKLLSGCYDEDIIYDAKGNPKAVLTVLSWNFSKMDDYSFRALFEKIKSACATHFCLTDEQFDIICQYD